MNREFTDILVQALNCVKYSDEKDDERMKSAIQDLAGSFPKEKKFMMRNADDQFLRICRRITKSPDQYESIRKICKMSFMDYDPKKMDQVKYSRLEADVFAECRGVVQKLAEELGKTYLPKE